MPKKIPNKLFLLTRVSGLDMALPVGSGEIKNLMNANSMEAKLASDILMMMAGNFDRWDPDFPNPGGLIESAKLAADGIAQKLVKALAEKPKLDHERWHLIVTSATRNAFMELTEDGPLDKVGQDPSFVDAVVECTSATVAPAESDWSLLIEKKEERRQRRQLKALGVPRHLIGKVMGEWRALRKIPQ